MSKVTVLKNEFGHFEYELFEGRYLVHLQLYKWSVSLYKTYLTIFESWCKTLPVTSVFCVIPNDNPKLLKFETMFGFRVVGETHDMLVMEKKIGDSYGN